MALFHGGDSKYLVRNRDGNKYWGLYTLALLFISLILYWALQLYVRLSFFPSISISLGMVVLGIILIKITDSFYIPLLKFNNGIIGERRVREELKKLSDEFSVYQDVKLPMFKWNIDFVVIGPTGIFTIEVKNKKGKIDFKDGKLIINNQNDQKDLNEAKKEAVCLHEYLIEKLKIKIGFIYPVLVFTGHTEIHFGLNMIENSYIVHKNYLLRVLTEKSSGVYEREYRNILEKELAAISPKK